LKNVIENAYKFEVYELLGYSKESKEFKLVLKIISLFIKIIQPNCQWKLEHIFANMQYLEYRLFGIITLVHLITRAPTYLKYIKVYE